MTSQDLHSALHALPKAELHLHLEGTIAPATVVELAARHGEVVTEAEALARYRYSDFHGFLNAFKWVTSYLRGPADYALITRRMAEKLVSQNVVYAEVFFAMGILHFRRQDAESNLSAVYEEGVKARRSGLRLQWIFDATRQFGVEAAMEVAQWAVRFKKQDVVAIGIGGDELSLPAKDFRAVYEFAASNGLHLHIHAGEVGGPQSVRDALEDLHVERIGHGIGVMHDASLMDSLAASRIPLEFCPASNLCTGALAKQIGKPSAQIEDHPLKDLHRRGLMITLGSDDPAMFHTSLDAEYDAGLRMGLSPAEMADIAGNGFAAAFLPEKEKDCPARRLPFQTRGARSIITPMKAHVWVMLKSTVLDPQGQTIQHALASLGYQEVKDVRQGKFFVLELNGLTRESAQQQVEKIAKDVLTNPVIEQFRFEILE